MRAFRRKGSKSKSNPNSASTSPRKKPRFFPESPLSNKVAATTSDPTPEARAHPLPRPASLPESVSVSGDDARDFAIDRHQDATNTQRERKAMSTSPRIHHVPEEKNRRYSEASISPRTSHFVCLGSEVSTSYGANLRSSPLLSPPNSRRHQKFSLSPVHPELHSSGGEQIDGLQSPPHPLPLLPGSSNGFCSGLNNSQWQKGKLLGMGTFGQVYQGFNREGGHMCAIKEVPVVTDDNNSRECLRQLNQEISLLSQLKHPNIVRYYGSELTDDRLSVFLEYISGGSIHKLLQDYGSFKEPVIRNYTRQILSGLAFLHGRNTVHRDIKGANILVGTNGEVKLADFGLAKHISSYNSIRSLRGSPYWIAPEVAMNSNGYNLSVDIWSLGCTVIEMATSKHPWSQYEWVAALFKIATSKDLPDIPDHLSPDGKDFLRLCLQRDPATRLTATQLLEHPFVLDQSPVRNLSPKHSTSPAAVSPKANFTESQQRHKTSMKRPYSSIQDSYDSMEQVPTELAKAGLESWNLIIGIDFTKSNEFTGKNSFNRLSLHHIGDSLNPYEKAIRIIGETMSKSDDDNLIPCFGFGDDSTHDRDVFSFYHDQRPCHGTAEALKRYWELIPHTRLSGPTSFAPVIEMAMTVVERSGGQHHVLLIIADGQVTRSTGTADGQLSPYERSTIDAIVKASEFPLSIVLVGVGDGPWDMMREFDDNIPARSFDNFQFVNFTEIMSKRIPQPRKEAEFALAASMEIRSQYKAIMGLQILGHQTGRCPSRVPLPPPTGTENISANLTSSSTSQLMKQKQDTVQQLNTGSSSTTSPAPGSGSNSEDQDNFEAMFGRFRGYFRSISRRF